MASAEGTRGATQGGADCAREIGHMEEALDDPGFTAGRIVERPRLLFIVTEDWYFVSHRLPLAVAASRAGFEVAVATRTDCHRQVIAEAGIRLFEVAFNRGGLAPFDDLATLQRLTKICRAFSPHLVHNVALKPVVYGSLAAKLAGVPAIVNALGGLGFVFSSPSRKARILRRAVARLLRLALSGRRSRLIVQNAHDRDRLVTSGLVEPDRVRVVRGAGVELARYRIVDCHGSPPLVVFPARFLVEKGILEFVEAARLIRATGISARFALAGKVDRMNPSSVTTADVEAWSSEGVVEVWGWREDMPAVFAQSQIVCLPSHHEGLPKALLEAAASATAIVATDIPGCREIVLDGETGRLVPVGDVEALAAVLSELLGDAEQRCRLGRAARRRVEAEFVLSKVVDETLAIYGELLA